jgi:hypothetical protein
MVTLLQISGQIFPFSQKEFGKLRPFLGGVSPVQILKKKD